MESLLEAADEIHPPVADDQSGKCRHSDGIREMGDLAQDHGQKMFCNTFVEDIASCVRQSLPEPTKEFQI